MKFFSNDVSLIKSGTSTNLVPDPGFESGTSWTGAANSPGTWLWRGTWAESSPRSGTYGMAITNMVYGSMNTKLIPVTPGTQYDVSTWARGQLGILYQGSGGFILRAQAYDAAGLPLAYQDIKASRCARALC